MIKCVAKIALMFFICLCFACSQANNKPLSIEFNPDSTAFRIEGINKQGLLTLRQLEQRDSLNKEWVWVNDGKGRIAGALTFEGEALYFNPVKPLEKGVAYTVNTLLNASFGSTKEVLKGQVSYQVKPLQKVLVR